MRSTWLAEPRVSGMTVVPEILIAIFVISLLIAFVFFYSSAS
jgi:hypothetical protein